MSSLLEALVLEVPEDDDGDMRKAARREKARRLREALKSEDDDALADCVWPEEAEIDLDAE